MTARAPICIRPRLHAFATIGLLAAAANAQPDTTTTRPDAAARMVRVFDFEERDTNPGEVPRYWFRSQDSKESPRPDFPAWNRAELVYDLDATAQGTRVKRGTGSVMLPTQGGSTSLMLGRGVLPVFAEADYVVHASVRTTGLSNARAGVIARLLDASGKAIAGSQNTSRFVQSETGWTNLSVDICSDSPGAAYIQIELVLLQPAAQSAYGGNTTRSFSIVKEDRDGAAYFDDVAVLQLPRVELTTESPANITPLPASPRLRSLVRDMAGELLTQTIEVLDAAGTVVDKTTVPLTGGGGQHTWQPKLPRLGWYRARLSLTNADNINVGGSVVDLLWVPTGAAATDTSGPRRLAPMSTERSRLGLTLPTLALPELAALPGAVRATGVGNATFPAWARDLTPETARAHADRLQTLVGALIADGCSPTVTLGPVPAGITSDGRYDAGDAWPVLAGDRQQWLRFAEDIFDRLGTRVPAWQVGRVDDDRAFWRTWSSELAHLQNDLDGYVPGSAIAIPASIHHAWDVQEVARSRSNIQIVARVPAVTSAASLREAIPAWLPLTTTSRENASVRLSLEPSDVAAYGPTATAEQLARQMIEAWRIMGSGTEGNRTGASLTLSRPWTLPQGRRPQIRPSPALGAWIGTSQRLNGRRIVGEFPIAEGVRCYILAPLDATADENPGALVLWNESAPPPLAHFEGAVGRGPVKIVDIYGNTRPLPLVRASSGAQVARVDLTGAPVFIEGVDVPLVRFLSSVRIEPPFLDATGEVLERSIVLSNPWPAGITGTVSIVEPGGYTKGPKDRSWRIVPRSSPFNIPPGKSATIPFTVAFSPTEEAGNKPFLLALDVTADAPYGLIETTRQVEVGLKEYALELRASAAGSDAIVEAIVTNNSDRTMTLELTALAPGQPRSRAVITNLAPGRQVIRRFSYMGLRDELTRQRVIVSLTDTESRLRLNRSAEVP